MIHLFTDKEHAIEHEYRRRTLWERTVEFGVNNPKLTHPHMKKSELCVMVADNILKAFDERFPGPVRQPEEKE